MKENEEIDKCPFCGGDALAVQTKDFSGWWYVECSKPPCYARILASDTKQKAINQWNTRK